MGEIRKIMKVESHVRGVKQGRSWQIYSELEDGRVWLTRFPVTAFDHLIGAYGLSDDVTGLLDVIMHTPHIQDWYDPAYFEQDAAWQAGMITTLPIDAPGVFAGGKMPVHLYNADTIDDARRAHLLRIAEVKSRMKYDVVGGRKILDPIYRTPHISSLGVEQQREITQQFRDAMQGRKRTSHPHTQAGAELRTEDRPAYRRRQESIKKDIVPVTLAFDGNRVIL